MEQTFINRLRKYPEFECSKGWIELIVATTKKVKDTKTTADTWLGRMAVIHNFDYSQYWCEGQVIYRIVKSKFRIKAGVK